MKKILHTFLFRILAILVLFFSCRKADLVTQNTETNSNESSEFKFFNNHRTSDVTEKTLVNYIKRQNDKTHFVEQTVKQIGLPRWNKAFKMKPNSTNSIQANLTGDSTEIYYIPFVRDSQNFVNAAMIISTNPTDTTFNYKCDWQYSQMQNNTNSISDSAENFAAFFMFMDKTVFGYNKFEITDPNLFKINGNSAIEIELTNINSSSNNLLSYVEVCQNVSVSVISCDYPESEECRDGCDQCIWCRAVMNYEYCYYTYVEVGGGTGTGNTGGTSGGGGTSSGSTPPNCNNQPTSPFARNTFDVNNLDAPCSGGWTPVPINPSINYLLTTMGIVANSATHNWLKTGTLNNLRATEIHNYLALNNNSQNAIDFCWLHLNKMMAEHDYASFVAAHPNNIQNVYYAYLSEFESEVTNPFIQSVILSIGEYGCSSTLLKLYQGQTFTQNAAYKIKFKEEVSLMGNSGNQVYGKTDPVVTLPNGKKEITIHLNKTLLHSGVANEFIATVIIHEIVHGLYSIAVPSSTEEQQHISIFEAGEAINIARAVKELFPNQNFSYTDAIALALQGVDDITFPNGIMDQTRNTYAEAADHYGMGLLYARNKALEYINGGLGTHC